jgi:hypothetical protein
MSGRASRYKRDDNERGTRQKGVMRRKKEDEGEEG